LIHLVLVLLTGAAVARPDGIVPSAENAQLAGSAVRRILSESRYKFCHDEKYPLTHFEAAWCPHVGASNERCPALPLACAAGATYPDPESRRLGDRSLDRTPSRSHWFDWDVSLPHFGGLARLLVWALILGGVITIVMAILKHAVGQKQDVSGAPAPQQATAAAPALAVAEIETDVARLLELARAAGARAEFARAIDHAYAALLRRLDGEGLIRIHPWRTNGDYVADLRPRPQLRSNVRNIVRDVERTQFGAEPPTAAAFESVLDRVVPIATRSLLSIVLLCSLVSCADRRGAASDSPSGSSAVVQMLSQLGFKVKHRLRSLDKLDDSDKVLVLLTGAELPDSTRAHVVEWLDAGGTLIVASGEPVVPELKWSWGASEGDVVLSAQPGSAIRAVAPGNTIVRWSEPGAVQLLARGTDTYALEATHGEGTLVALADDYLLTNGALPVSGNAAVLVALLRAFGTDIEIADAMTGAAAQNPVTSVARGKLAPLLVQLGFVLLLFFVYKGAAFGQLREPPGASRRSFVEHVRALGLLYAKAHADRHAVALYSAYALDRLRERVQTGGRRGLTPLAEAIAARTGRPLGDVMRVLVEAQGARDRIEPPSRRGVATQEWMRQNQPGEGANQDLVPELQLLLKEIGGPR
jgi:hypothetical protein